MKVEHQQYFRVALGLEAVAELFALLPEFLVVINLTVEYERVATAEVGHRLMRAFVEVDDGQPRVP